MKKSLLTLLISAAFLTACNDKDSQALSEKLLKAEQTIAELNQQLGKSSSNSTVNQQHIPLLNVEIAPLFSKQETIKVKGEDGENELQLYYFTSIAKTGIDWLDNLLFREMFLRSENTVFTAGEEKAEVIKNHEASYQESRQELQEMGGFVGVSMVNETQYLGQRGNIASFSVYRYTYTGGAHGMYFSEIYNVDLAKKTVISLDNFIPKANQKKLEALLWEVYERESPNEETFTKKEDFSVSSEFYFSKNGVTFVYPPYALGPFVQGEMELEADRKSVV